ncbi:MAG: toll/interleukin-1 receptor domain-containing protein [Promethearchaeota archaeon]
MYQDYIIYLRQGADRWNTWRHKNPRIKPNLSRQIFPKLDLSEFDFSYTDFSNSNLSELNLSESVLYKANFSYSDLSNTDLSKTSLYYTTFFRTDLRNTNFSLSKLRGTSFTFTDLSQSKYLDTIEHQGPSSIDISTLHQSKKLPKSFLRGLGVPELYIRNLSVFITHEWQFYTCFISHSSHDKAFVRKLYNALQHQGIRCWYDKEDATWGKEIKPILNEKIEEFDKVVVVCSEDSLKSEWVNHEIERALQKEEKNREIESIPEILFPIIIDKSLSNWLNHLKKFGVERIIGDFYDWRSPIKFNQSLTRLVQALKSDSPR